MPSNRTSGFGSAQTRACPSAHLRGRRSEVDLSKNLITTDVLAALVRLAEQVEPAGAAGGDVLRQHINVTENRAVLHTALL